MTAQVTWPADHDAVLIRMWRDGRSAREIGNALGRSKNSVISRARRLPECEPRESPIAFHSRPPFAPRPKPQRLAPLKPPIQSRITTTPADPSGFTLSATARCKFPMWDGKAKRGDPDYGRFCCTPAIEGKPYCPAHFRICYREKII